ncbi:MAG: hypothetical protein IJO79_06160, partial [Firmicutes bacterium]|nr:hypothetical protein [Bacillota bacterium]
MFTENIGFKLHSQIRAEIDNITSYPAHVHPNALEMILVLKGQVRISDTVLKHRLSPGDIHIFNMGDP